MNFRRLLLVLFSIFFLQGLEKGGGGSKAYARNSCYPPPSFDVIPFLLTMFSIPLSVVPIILCIVLVFKATRTVKHLLAGKENCNLLRFMENVWHLNI